MTKFSIFHIRFKSTYIFHIRLKSTYIFTIITPENLWRRIKEFEFNATTPKKFLKVMRKIKTRGTTRSKSLTSIFAKLDFSAFLDWSDLFILMGLLGPLYTG